MLALWQFLPSFFVTSFCLFLVRASVSFMALHASALSLSPKDRSFTDRLKFIWFERPQSLGVYREYTVFLGKIENALKLRSLEVVGTILTSSNHPKCELNSHFGWFGLVTTAPQQGYGCKKTKNRNIEPADVSIISLARAIRARAIEV